MNSINIRVRRDNGRVVQQAYWLHTAIVAESVLKLP
jgi:hypothetical protein